MNVALFIAYNGREDRPVPNAEIVAYFDHLKERSLEPVLQKLSGSGIITSIKGSKGGYYVEDPENTTLRDIFECFVDSASPEDGGFGSYERILSAQIEDWYGKGLGMLSVTSLKYLCNEARKAYIPTIETPPPLDFVV
ncbi:MAG: Rrf2 family transcriptional regulator [Alphaproteobacteria bacterium]|nr:Rrf2 family transcriptional regulator [Alphaproteobacteria bacterium]MCB9974434.1 Rrf2 family transcriptional regulator [Rhodospirillales bacterium]